MLPRVTRIVSASVESGPRAVVLTRGAKKRGAAQKTREFAALVSLLGKHKLEVVVEIGTLHGGTLWTWCQVARQDALIVSIDLPGGSFGGGYETDAVPILEGYARKEQSVVLIRDDSHKESTLGALEHAVDERSIDFLFIDGDHSYDGVKRDFRMYSPLVRPGGLIALHDIIDHPAEQDCEVARFWKEVRSGSHVVEFVDRADVRDRGQWGGIGVVITPSQ